MMNRLRNRASPARTWFGGIVGVPSALRVSDSTTMILVKAVVSTSRAGATDSTVSSRMMLTVWLGLPPTGSTLTDTVPAAGLGVGPGAAGSASSDGRAVAVSNAAPDPGAVAGAAAAVPAAAAEATEATEAGRVAAWADP